MTDPSGPPELPGWTSHQMVMSAPSLLTSMFSRDATVLGEWDSGLGTVLIHFGEHSQFRGNLGQTSGSSPALIFCIIHFF